MLPPRTPNEPLKIKPYTYHGVEFHKRDSKEWVGTCPFCTKPKFYVDSETGRSDCKVCHWEQQYKEAGVSGNGYGFLKFLWRVSYDACKEIDYQWLAEYRFLEPNMIRQWGVCKSLTTGEWLVPGYGVDKEPNGQANIVQLYKYIRQKDGHHELWPTPGFAESEDGSHGIVLPRSCNNTSTTVYCAEGVWDAIALSSALRTNDPSVLRGGKGSSTGLWSESDKGYVPPVVAVPGAGIFNKRWTKYTAGKYVVFLYDNDHPKLNEQTKTYSQAGYQGTKRAAGIVSSPELGEAASVSWLDWNLDGKGYDPDLPNKYDVRDWLTKDKKDVDKLLSYVRPVPNEWLSNAPEKVATKPVAKGREKIQVSKCESWKELTDAFRLAAKWTPELHGGLAVSLACICSVTGVGVPLWIRLISPPSTYKSQICKALGTNERYCIMDDGMNGFYSGMDMGDGKDYSLVTRWFNKTLITKEGSTLFTNSRSEEIIGQARAIYDGEVDRRWNNGKHCSHRGWRGSWILAGTPNMKDYDDNDLGPRFIDYRIVKDITEELEDDIIMRAISEQAGLGIVNGTTESSDNPDYLLARKLCGGYIDYLRNGVDSNTVKLPDVPYDFLLKIGNLAKFIERMRGRPSKNLGSESVEIALGARVGQQLVKLARFLSIVMQRQSIDREVMNVVVKVAMDTSDGWSLSIVSALMKAINDGDEGLNSRELAAKCGKSLKELESLLLYLPKIGVLEWYTPIDMPSPVRQAKLRLTDSFRSLYSQVMSITKEV